MLRHTRRRGILPGMRLPDCHRYPECLTAAARLDAPGVPCRRCGRYQPTDALMLYHDEIAGLLRLLLALDDEPEPAYPLI